LKFFVVRFKKFNYFFGTGYNNYFSSVSPV
jgi:hypothetical protein